MFLGQGAISKQKEVFIIESIIVDVDGTLWDTTEVVAQAWNKAISEVGGTTKVVSAAVVKCHLSLQSMVLASRKAANGQLMKLKNC